MARQNLRSALSWSDRKPKQQKLFKNKTLQIMKFDKREKKRDDEDDRENKSLWQKSTSFHLANFHSFLVAAASYF